MKGSDLEYFDSIFTENEGEVISGQQVTEILSYLCTNKSVNFSLFLPRAIKFLYSEVREHILCNYMSKEIWLSQCYSVQNGSFENLMAMESVPMSKFVVLCKIHKDAMDKIGNNDAGTTP
jgi:hypothetical protein